MKKRLIPVVMVVLAVSVVCAQSALAAEKKKGKSAVEVKPSLTDAQRAVLAEGALTQLNNQTWTIKLVQQGAKKPQVETDILTFSGQGVVSQFLSARGFGGSQFSLSIQDDGSAVWETVQRNANDDIAAWRGELRGSTMNGTLSIRYKAGMGETYSFSTPS
jgi:hypothetical protein